MTTPTTNKSKDLQQSTVRYVKNGAGGRWWAVAKAHAELHASWTSIPVEQLVKPDFAALRKRIKLTQDFNALHCLLERPSKHVWITFEDGYMWWCTVRDGIVANPKGEGKSKGQFWLVCHKPWSNRSVGGKLLAIADLPGTVSTVSGFKGTVCQPKAWQSILRIIRDEKNSDATEAECARIGYQRAVKKTVKALSPKDFEQLVDLILVRTGWARISTLGKTREGVDVEVENVTAAETAFVQVKSTATQAVLNDYIARFSERRDFYSRMIFAVHTPQGDLTVPGDLPVQVWAGDRLAHLVVLLGLGEWVESRLP